MGIQGSSVWSENPFLHSKGQDLQNKKLFHSQGSLVEVYDIDHIIGGDAGFSSAGRQNILQKTGKVY